MTSYERRKLERRAARSGDLGCVPQKPSCRGVTVPGSGWAGVSWPAEPGTLRPPQ
jgi:hypothetical protein